MIIVGGVVVNKTQLITIFVCLFALGWLSNSLYFQLTYTGVEKPVAFGSLLRNSNLELLSPQDHVTEENIHVYDDRILIDLKGAFWSSFTDTNSMDPLIDKGANGVEIRPSSPDEIKPGDIISYESKLADGIIIHRVVEKGSDEKGVYFITKGDNNPTKDPEKVRFEQVKGVLVGVIY